MNSSMLKVLACYFMLVDHVGVVLFPDNIYLRVIGRIAMPIFCYQIAIGLRKTSNFPLYLKRLFIFALVGQFAYYYTFQYKTLNILFAFLIVALLVKLIDRKKKLGIVFSVIAFLFLQSHLLDYGRLVIYLVMVFYYFDSKKVIALLIALVSVWYMLIGQYVQMYMFLSIPFIYYFNGEKGRDYRQLFYWFYPLHMIALKIIKGVLM